MSVDDIRAAFARRPPADPRYHPLNPAQHQALQEREHVLVGLLRRQGWTATEGLYATELGCGTGSNLLTLLQLGFAPARLTGVELLPERVRAARERLPTAIRVLEGDARAAAIEAGSQDLVLAFTVFSSVLDEALQQQLAAAAWRWLRPGGAVIAYDFTVDNPRNPDVRGMPLARWQQLFPAAVVTHRRLTLAPPLARRLPAGWLPLLQWLPFLRTHRMLHLLKP